MVLTCADELDANESLLLDLMESLDAATEP